MSAESLKKTDADGQPIAVPSQQIVEPKGAVAKPTEAEVIARLSALKSADYDRVRKEEAKALGIQVKTLDEMVKAAQSGGRTADRMPFVDHEPAEDPVDPAQLFDEIAAVIQRYVVLDDEQVTAAVLWPIHTHLTDVADVSPLSIINAPEPECAKTLFQTVLAHLCYRPLPASNASLSALFRAIELWKPTILIDEADTFFRENAELHGMVNAGYKRGGFVLRSEATGDSFEPRMFSVYGPKCIAGIALERHLPDSTMSRGIVFNMRRKLPHEKVERLRNADDAEFDRLASKVARFAADYSQQIRLARPKLPDELSDRAQDNWEPLLAIAECAGQTWVQRATNAALKMSAASETAGGTGNELLADIKEVFDGMSAEKVGTVELLAKLTGDEEKSWATYNRGKPMTPRQLAKQLEIYGIKSKTVRLGPTKTPKGYELAQFEDAFKRYLKPCAESESDGSPNQMAPAGGTEAAGVPSPTAFLDGDFAPDDGPPPPCGAVADTGDPPDVTKY